MKVLQIGLGSMGRRRLRNLTKLGFAPGDVVAHDPRADRRVEAEEQFGVFTVGSPEKAYSEVDAYIVSTPPDHHLEYLREAVRFGKPVFVEASVVLEGLDELRRAARDAGVLVCPSCTMLFHPSIARIRELVSSGRWGTVTSFAYYMGQYLPDWHPWEDIRSFYVSRHETSATREMVAFELTWLTRVVGWPDALTGMSAQTLDMGVEIDDAYGVVLRGDGWLGTMLVDVVARQALRRLVLNLETAQIQWSWEDKVVRLYDVDEDEWTRFEQAGGDAADGYNVNIIEDMYVAELEAFFAAVEGKEPFPNTLEDDVAVLGLLAAIDEMGGGAVTPTGGAYG